MSSASPLVIERKRYAGPAVLLYSAKLLLDYERSRASNPLFVLPAFLSSQRKILERLSRLGYRRCIELTRLELQCARAGLAYPGAGNSNEPPWRLPELFVNLPAENLPAHPLIEPALLSMLAGEHLGARPSAQEALSQLLMPRSLDARWRGVPRIDRAGLPPPGNARVAVCLHLFYPDMWPILRAALAAIPEPWDLYVSVPDFACTAALARIAEECPAVCFLPCPNRGRDVLPFLRWLDLGIFDRYDAICKLHSKRSPHMRDGARWLAQVLQSLLGEPKAIEKLLERMRRSMEIGMIGPQPLLIGPDHPIHRGGNQRIVKALATRASLPITALDRPFFAGTMFWFRPSALTRLRALNLKEEDFPLEMGQTDGTLAHALERLIAPLMEASGFRVDSIN